MRRDHRPHDDEDDTQRYARRTRDQPTDDTTRLSVDLQRLAAWVLCLALVFAGGLLILLMILKRSPS